MKKPRIALMTYAMDNRRARGTALYTRQLVQNLIEDDSFDIFLVHFDRVDDPLYSKAKEIIMPPLKLPCATRFVRTLLFFWKYRNDTFDIIHWFQPRLYPFFWLAPARRIVVTVHGAGDITAPGKKIFSRRVFNFILTHFNRYVDAAIAVSEHARSEIVKYYRFESNRVFVTYNGVAESFAPLDKETSRCTIERTYGIHGKFILNVARPEPHKNLDRLIGAYESVRRENGREEKLVIAGAPAQSYGMTYERALGSPYAKDIIFSGYIESADLNALYVAAELFVFPSLDEGFGLPVIEAFASGTAVVTSNVSALPEVAGDAAVLTDPYDEKAMAKAMLLVLDDDALRSSLIHRGLQRAAMFTWKENAHKTTALYRALLLREE